MESRPQVVAHRGASAKVAEHTLQAFVAALDACADRLEAHFPQAGPTEAHA